MLVRALPRLVCATSLVVTTDPAFVCVYVCMCAALLLDAKPVVASQLDVANPLNSVVVPERVSSVAVRRPSGVLPPSRVCTDTTVRMYAAPYEPMNPHICTSSPLPFAQTLLRGSIVRQLADENAEENAKGTETDEFGIPIVPTNLQSPLSGRDTNPSSTSRSNSQDASADTDLMSPKTKQSNEIAQNMATLGASVEVLMEVMSELVNSANRLHTTVQNKYNK